MWKSELKPNWHHTFDRFDGCCFFARLKCSIFNVDVDSIKAAVHRTHLAYCLKFSASINYIQYQRHFACTLPWTLLVVGAHGYKISHIVLKFWWKTEGNNHSLYPRQREHTWLLIMHAFYAILHHFIHIQMALLEYFLQCLGKNCKQYTFLATLTQAEHRKNALFSVQFAFRMTIYDGRGWRRKNENKTHKNAISIDSGRVRVFFYFFLASLRDSQIHVVLL